MERSRVGLRREVIRSSHESMSFQEYANEVNNLFLETFYYVDREACRFLEGSLFLDDEDYDWRNLPVDESSPFCGVLDGYYQAGISPKIAVRRLWEGFFEGHKWKALQSRRRRIASSFSDGGLRRGRRGIFSMSLGYDYQNETSFDVELANLEDELGIDTQAWMGRFWRAVDRLEPGFMPPYNWGWDYIIDLISEGNRTPEEAAEDYLNEYAAVYENSAEGQEQVSAIEKVLKDLYGEDFFDKKLPPSDASSSLRQSRRRRVLSDYNGWDPPENPLEDLWNEFDHEFWSNFPWLYDHVDVEDFFNRRSGMDYGHPYGPTFDHVMDAFMSADGYWDDIAVEYMEDIVKAAETLYGKPVADGVEGLLMGDGEWGWEGDEWPDFVFDKCFCECLEPKEAAQKLVKAAGLA